MTLPISTAPGPEWLLSPGPVAYPDAIAAMRARIAAIRTGAARELVWFLEHPPLYTAGTSARPEDLAQPGRFETFNAGRGGQWTYHGPGQLVAYVMLDLTSRHGSVQARDTHAYVTALETWLIGALAEFDVDAGRRAGRIGVWVMDKDTGVDSKIGAIGVRITRWVSWHGISLNVRPDLDHFSGIVPCGIREHGVTSLRELGIETTIEDVQGVLQSRWASVFGPFNSDAVLDAATPETAQ